MCHREHACASQKKNAGIVGEEKELEGVMSKVRKEKRQECTNVFQLQFRVFGLAFFFAVSCRMLSRKAIIQ